MEMDSGRSTWMQSGCSQLLWTVWSKSDGLDLNAVLVFKNIKMLTLKSEPSNFNQTILIAPTACNQSHCGNQSHCDCDCRLYYAKIGIGTPSKDYYLQVDNGYCSCFILSLIIWGFICRYGCRCKFNVVWTIFPSKCLNIIAICTYGCWIVTLNFMTQVLKTIDYYTKYTLFTTSR
jgi:hypothetical protein